MKKTRLTIEKESKIRRNFFSLTNILFNIEFKSLRRIIMNETMPIIIAMLNKIVDIALGKKRMKTSTHTIKIANKIGLNNLSNSFRRFPKDIIQFHPFLVFLQLDKMRI